MSLLIVTLLSVILLAACGSFSKNSYGNDVIHINIDDLAPKFELKDLDGKSVKLDDIIDQKVYVKYWASWCPSCLAGLDELNTLASQNNNFRVISIVTPNYKGEQQTEDFKEWFQSLGFDQIQVLLDEDGIWADEFEVITYPTSYFIGRHGVLEKTFYGHLSNEQIKNVINEIN